MKETVCEDVRRNVRKVLFVNVEGRISGAEKSILLNVGNLSPEFIPLVACPAKGELATELQKMGIQVVPLFGTPVKWNGFMTWLAYYLLMNVKMLWTVLLHRPKIIHANTTKAAITAVGAIVFTRIRLVWHVRDIGGPRWVLKLLSCLSQRIFVVSQAIYRMLRNAGIDERKLCLHPNSIEINECSIRLVETESSQKCFTFANIGQFVPWKKQMLFIGAAEAYLKKGNHAKFLIVGDDVFGRDLAYGERLIKRVMESRFCDAFEMVPWQSDMHRLWQQIDCLVHTADAEPFGRVIIEAMQNHVPVIAADAYGPSEIIQDCVTGLLFEPDDVHELCCCLETVSQNGEFMREIVSAGYQYVCLKHDIRQNIREIESVYTSVA